MSPIGSALVALKGASGWPKSVFDVTPAYAGFFADDPAWVPPTDGAAVPAWLTRGTLAQSGAYLDATNGLVLPGVDGNSASIPDGGEIPTGDMSAVFYIAPTDWTVAAEQSTLLAQWASVGARSRQFYVATNGKLYSGYSTDGTAATYDLCSNTVLPGVDGTGLYVGVTVDVDNGAGGHDYTVWTSATGVAGTWVQLGTTYTAAGNATCYNSSGIIEFGANSTSVYGMFAGRYFTTATYNSAAFTAAGPGGTQLLDVDFRRSITNQFVCSTGQTVTVVSTFNPSQATGSKQPLFDAAVPSLNGRAAVDFDGVDDYLQIITGVSLVQPYTVLSVFELDTVAANAAILGVNSAANTRRIGLSSTPNWVADTGTSLAGGTPVIATPYIRRDIVDGANSNITVNAASVVSGNADTGALDQIVLGAGRTAPSTYANYLDGRIGALIVYPGTPTTNPKINVAHNWLAYWYNLPRL